jgi:predicted nucleotidyltransferase
MTMLRDLATELGVSERTLRRAVADGTIRAERPSAHRLRIAEEERQWVLRQWPTIARLRAALRTEPSVRTVVLFGSRARGRERAGSDLDLLIDIDAPARGRLAALEERLAADTGREVQLVPLQDAERSPALMADAVRDGRVLVDRAGLWPRLKRREPQLRRAAEQRDQELLEEALRPLEATR